MLNCIINNTIYIQNTGQGTTGVHEDLGPDIYGGAGPEPGRYSEKIKDSLKQLLMYLDWRCQNTAENFDSLFADMSEPQKG